MKGGGRGSGKALQQEMAGDQARHLLSAHDPSDFLMSPCIPPGQGKPGQATRLVNRTFPVDSKVCATEWTSSLMSQE